MCAIVAVALVAVVPSPKFHTYCAIEPNATVEAEASKVVLEPARPGVTVNEATDAWSGVMATASGPLPTVMLEPAVPFARSIGVTVLAAPAL